MIYTSSLKISIHAVLKCVCVFAVTSQVLSWALTLISTPHVWACTPSSSVSRIHRRDIDLSWGPRKKRKERQRRPYDDPARRGNRKWDLWPAERLLLCFPARVLMELLVSLRFLSRLMLGDTDESWETAHKAKSHMEPKGGLSYTIAWETTRP